MQEYSTIKCTLRGFPDIYPRQVAVSLLSRKKPVFTFPRDCHANTDGGLFRGYMLQMRPAEAALTPLDNVFTVSKLEV